ncbi:hypothetical protein CKN80_02605 [Carnobacterium divergens]|uniref:restriction endonuclease subunit S n=1 Tax=Carnobacterium divergens TaxID=2748 RepID=UPI0010722CBB|nr:restriction endonuclease subunit S [Carnobacterium divergens]TFJ46650.1 hypothetical protein CKN79_02605 [Carnobacterium divergens]TFJ53613.1 hypothetical protein CKN80_02605 [Carnobacterium divergens]
MKNNQIPEVRFSEFTDDWEQRKLSVGMTEYTNRVFIQEDKNYKQVSVKNIGEIVLRGEKIGSKIGRKRQAKVNLKDHPNTLIFTRQTVEQGGIGFAPKETDGAIVTENMPTIDINEKKIDCNYLLAYVKTQEWYRHVILKNIEGGTAQVAIHEDSILSSEVLIPKIDEQQKIGSFFKQLGDTIALHQHELEILKNTKKVFLQKMFPKEGEKVPEVRFPEFTDDWEQRKFENLLDTKNGVRRGPFGSALKKEIFVSKSDYVVYEQHNAIYDHYETRYNITESKFKELSKFSLTEGDFIMSGAGTIGRISRVPYGIKQGVFNQALIRFKINMEITDTEYFIQFVRADNMQKKLTGANPGSAITNLVPMSEVKKWDVLVPSRHEQQKIGSFFKQLDDTIALHQRELEILKNTKKAFLQKMFV